MRRRPTIGFDEWRLSFTFTAELNPAARELRLGLLVPKPHVPLHLPPVPDEDAGEALQRSFVVALPAAE